jgi:hypothetical protein
MSLTLKLGSLAIRTLAKPLAVRAPPNIHIVWPLQNYIKRNAQDHERFRKLCVGFAQNLHRIDTRLRLGLLQDPQILARNLAREVAEAEARRQAAAAATAAAAEGAVAGPKTEAQVKRDSDRIKKEIKQAQDKASKALPRVRPLTEAKAIETGANFISETFLFCVAGAAIVFEYWRSKRKESTRRDEVSDRLDQIELKIDRLEQGLAADRVATSTVPPKVDEPAEKASGAGPLPPATREGPKASLTREGSKASASVAWGLLDGDWRTRLDLIISQKSDRKFIGRTRAHNRVPCT